MSDHKFSTGHLLAFLISAVSLIVTLLQPSTNPRPSQFADFDLLGGPSRVFVESPVIHPLHVDVFESYAWTDSFPFWMEPLAANGIRFIRIERYLLPENRSNSNAGLELGPEAGGRDLLVEFTLDPAKRRVREFRRKTFYPYTSGNTVVQGDFERISYEPSGTPGYPNMTRFFQKAGKEIRTEGRWQMGDGNAPRDFSFDGAQVRRYLPIDRGFAVLELGRENSLTIHLNEKGLSASRMLRKAKKCREEALKSAGISSIQQIEVIEGRSASTRSARVWTLDSAGTIASTVEQQFDSLGKPIVYVQRSHSRGDTLAVDQFLYNLKGQLVKAVHEKGNIEDVHEFRYSMTGWPERMLHYRLLPDGGIRIVSRTFFKFRQH